MSWEPSRRLPPAHRPGATFVIERDADGRIRGVRQEGQPPPTLWRCSCDGCGAPLQRSDIQCSYCLRATGQAVDAVYTQQQNYSVAARFVTPNEAREMLDVTRIGDTEPRLVPRRGTDSTGSR